MPQPQKGYITILLLILIALGFLLSGGLAPFQTQPINSEQGSTPVASSPQSAAQTLQLQNLEFTTNAPTTIPFADIPTPVAAQATCQMDSTKTTTCTCAAGESVGVICENKRPGKPFGNGFPNPLDGTCPDNGLDCAYWANLTSHLYSRWGCDGNSCLYIQAFTQSYTKYKTQCSDKQICFGKPVIYLYPPSPTFVSVSLSIPGSIIESIPAYPHDGWQNILALPNGMLIYQGDMYKELYYESSVTNTLTPPNQGMSIPTANLQQELTTITAQLGLLPPEQREFLDYWLPRLYALHSPYILFSILSQRKKEQVDHVTITPYPDTRIEFIAYFKPLASPEILPPLLFKPIPKRTGFTEVEWGGTIAK